ncbi:MAG: prenyltransferase/squalene oxidase repeat-containing protein [Candidatus Bathyarchaeia archaeon]
MLVVSLLGVVLTPTPQGSLRKSETSFGSSSGVILESVTSNTPDYAENMERALAYLRGQQTFEGDIGGYENSAWVVMALVAAGEDPYSCKMDDAAHSIMDYLRDNVDKMGTKATDYERTILALTAAKADVENFGGVDYLRALISFYRNGQIGDETLLNDDYWGILALISTGERANSEVIQASREYILRNQNIDGGWGFAVGGHSDTDDTSAAVMALISAGESPNSTAIRAALEYLKTSQTPDGGFSWRQGSNSSNSLSTAWVVSALRAVGEDPTSAEWEINGSSPLEFLLSLQDTDGAFRWTRTDRSNSVYTTAAVLTALSGKSYPVIIDPQVVVRVEGPTSTLFSDTITLSGSVTITDSKGGQYTINADTPISALDAASQRAGFSYTATYSPGFSELFIADIAGSSSWMYRVNGVSPWYGGGYGWQANGPNLANGDEILWYYTSTWTELPLRVSVDKTGVTPGGVVTVTVTTTDQDYYHNPPNPWPTVNWVPVQGATVHADRSYSTGADGKVEIPITSGTFIYAEKSNYIRSNKIFVAVELSGYTTEQIEALAEAQEEVEHSGNVEYAYNRLVEKAVIPSDGSGINLTEESRRCLTENFGDYLERYPTLEGRVLLLHMLGITQIPTSSESLETEISVEKMANQNEVPQIVEDAKAILAAEGSVDAAYRYLVKNGVIPNDILSISENSDQRYQLLELYGQKLEKYPTFEGRILLLKALGIEELN